MTNVLKYSIGNTEVGGHGGLRVMKKHLIILLFAAVIISFIGCGNEGYFEGYIANTPIRAEVGDVKAFMGVPVDPASGASYSMMSYGITVTLEKKDVKLDLFIPPEFLYTPNVMILIPGYGQATLSYVSESNQVNELFGVEGSNITLYEIEPFNGGIISGYFDLYFDDNTSRVYGDFSTRIGLSYN